MYLNFEINQWHGKVHTETYDITVVNSDNTVQHYNANDKLTWLGLYTDTDHIIMAARRVLMEHGKWGFKCKDIVKIRPEWYDSPKDAKYIYVVTNVNEGTKRCYITCLNSGKP